MGDLILVTGAGGYLGRAVVAAALDRGHRVRALLRGPGEVPGAEVVRADLSALPDPPLSSVATVIHCAARLTGDEAAMQRDTVEATAALMRAAARAGVGRVVLAGSMAVHSGDLPHLSVVDEDSPLEPRPEARDGYCRAKLAQEEVARTLAAGAGMQLWILRLGALWDRERLWNGHLGLRLGPVLLRIGAGGEVPLLHVGNAATALVQAAETPARSFEVLNIVDDDRPDRRTCSAALSRAGGPRIVLPLPYAVMETAAALGLSRPGLLRRPVLRARMRPLRYANARAKARLGWTPALRFADLTGSAR